MRHFTKEEDDFLRRNRNKIPAKRLSMILGRSESSARQRMERLGCTPSAEAIQRFKKASFFPKGHVPFNKGKKMPPHVYDKAKATMFKKGIIPFNHKEVGTQRTTRDGYLEIKVSEPNKWQLLHRLVWEETFGEIPENMNIRFVTKDKTNVSPWNLHLVTKAENMTKNSYHNYGPEISKAIQLIGALNRQINKHEQHKRA